MVDGAVFDVAVHRYYSRFFDQKKISVDIQGCQKVFAFWSISIFIDTVLGYDLLYSYDVYGSIVFLVRRKARLNKSKRASFPPINHFTRIDVRTYDGARKTLTRRKIYPFLFYSSRFPPHIFYLSDLVAQTA